MFHKPLGAFVFLMGVIGILAVAQSASRSVNAAGLLASSQTPTPTCGPSTTPCKYIPLPEPKQIKFDQAAVAKIDLKGFPIVPTITSNVSAIYAEALRRGNNPRVFSKIGDCITATPNFLESFYRKDYALDRYVSLQKVIDYFSRVPARGNAAEFDSFGNPGLAAISGFNAAGVLDPIWSDPKWCKADESPLSCEYRVSKPAFALIMFGTNDLKSIKPDEYDFYLRRVIVQTVNSGVVPILSTFPTQPGLTEKSVLYNQITAGIAVDYDLPLINLWLALEPLPNKGIDPENPTHMTKPQSGQSASLAEADLQFGYNVRNLVTLQTLEAILKVVDPDGLK